MKRKISTISNNSFDSIYSEKKLRLLKIIVPPLLKFPDIFSSSLRREVGGEIEWKDWKESSKTTLTSSR